MNKHEINVLRFMTQAYMPENLYIFKYKNKYIPQMSTFPYIYKYKDFTSILKENETITVPNHKY